MGRFNDAFMNGAQDEKFQGVYNYLLDLLDLGYSVEALINGKLVVVSLNPTDGIKITSDAVKVFGVDATGRVFAESISNVSDAKYYMTYGYQGSPGLECFFPMTVGADIITTKFLGISPDVNGGIQVYDKNSKLRIALSVDGNFWLKDHNEKTRIGVWADGSMQINDGADRTVFSSSATDTQIKFGGATDNQIGVDATGAYFILAGTKHYLQTGGSGANGSWTKYPDGTMVCRHSWDLACTAATLKTDTWTYPEAFYATPTDVSISLMTVSATNTFTTDFMYLLPVNTTTATSNVKFSATQTYRLSMTAWGRWKA